MTKDYVTIIVPIYNAEKYLNECLDSLINQTYKYIKILLINDGSTDDSLNIALKYQQKVKNIHVISQLNMGVSSARNTGIKNADTEWICFVDADDLLEYDAIEKFMRLIQKYNIDCIISNIYFLKGNKKIKNKAMTEVERLYLNEEINILIRKFICKGVKEYQPYTWGIGAPWAKLYRLSIIKENNIYYRENLKRMEDGIFNMYYFYYSKAILYTNQCLYNYRVLSDSQSHKYNPNIVSETEDYFNELLEFNAIFNDELFSRGITNQIIRYMFSYMKSYYFASENSKGLYFNFISIQKLLNQQPYYDAKKNIDYSLLNLQEKIFVRLIVYNKIFILYFIIKLKEMVGR